MRSFLALLVLAGCSSGAATTTSAAANSPDDPPLVTPAAHAALPRVVSQGGATLAAPEVFALVYSNHPEIAHIPDDIRWVLASSWAGVAGAEYGIGRGTYAGGITLFPPERFPNGPPASMDDTTLRQVIEAGVTEGKIPRPSEHPNLTFAVFVPAGVTWTAAGSQLCGKIGGYHADVVTSYGDAPYMVIPSCASQANTFMPSTWDVSRYAFSHELMESATDPVVGRPAYLINDPQRAWSYGFGELADLCEASAPVVEEGRALARIWSNTAAAAGTSPCGPSPRPYFGVTTASEAPIAAHVSADTVIPLQAWSTHDVAPWQLSVRVVIGAGEVVTSLSAATAKNGDRVDLHVTGTTAGKGVLLAVVSKAPDGSDGSFWPVVVAVKN